MKDDNDTLFAPGEYIKDELEARGWTQESFADILGRPLRAINQILNGTKTITPQTAQEIAAAFGTSPELWLNLESAYRLGLERKEQNEVSRRAKLYEDLPIREMTHRRWIKPCKDIDDLEKEIEKYNAVKLAAAARKSTPYTIPEQRAWLYRAWHLACSITNVPPFNRDKAVKHLDDLHALTVDENELRHIPEILSAMGIRFLLIENLPRAKIDGATLWLDDNMPVIALSLRYDRIDGFWHTLCHELSHVLHGDSFSLDNNMIRPDKIGSEDISEQEQRADEEASNFLISKDKLESFIIRHNPRFSKINIIRFANMHKIHPGIVVGQLQHREAIKYSHSREMLVSVKKHLIDTATTDGWGCYPEIT